MTYRCSEGLSSTVRERASTLGLTPSEFMRRTMLDAVSLPQVGTRLHMFSNIGIDLTVIEASVVSLRRHVAMLLAGRSDEEAKALGRRSA